ncbi:MAG: aldo/keto reductase [Candidatus Latescibacteria bacterium]|nr:aldo/keto reductase [Candidatus Latescibacterota bacterium]
MEYRYLGRTGVQVSELCLGVMTFGGRTDEAEGTHIVRRALDAGINFVDTANVYNQGRSEEITGRALEGVRDQVFLASKVHGKMGDRPNDSGNSRFHIVRQVEASLKRLRTDRIDLYYLHRPDPATAVEEEIRAMDDLVRQGKILYAGTSHYPAWVLTKALNYAAQAGLAPFVADQPRYNVACRQIEVEFLPFCKDSGYGVVPHSPLFGGVLTGKYQRGQAPPADSRAGQPNNNMAERLTETSYAVVEGVGAVAQARGKSIAQVAIQWTLANPQIDSIIIGPRTLEQLEDNLGADGWRLTTEEVEHLNTLAPPVRE